MSCLVFRIDRGRQRLSGREMQVAQRLDLSCLRLQARPGAAIDQISCEIWRLEREADKEVENVP